MIKLNLIAISIVTYNPDINTIRNTVKLCNHFGLHVYVFDNASNNFSKLEEMISKFSNVHLTKEKENKGIAYALNSNFSLAKADGYCWLITLDQDSIISEEFLNKYLTVIEKMNNEPCITIICPKIIDKNINEVIFGGDGKYEEITDAEKLITSGSCIRVSGWQKVGGFYNKLFIDFVDTDFQEKILLANLRIIRCNEIILLHSVGKACNIKIGPWVIHCSNHNGFRRYYMVRNRLYFYRKYRSYCEYCKTYCRLLMGTIKICIFETEKLDKVKAFFKGWKDYKKLIS